METGSASKRNANNGHSCPKIHLTVSIYNVDFYTIASNKKKKMVLGFWIWLWHLQRVLQTAFKTNIFLSKKRGVSLGPMFSGMIEYVKIVNAAGKCYYVIFL